MSRIEQTHLVTKRLIVMTAIAVVIVMVIFGLTFIFGSRLMLSHLTFMCGIIGGFVSIQQRLKKVSDDELTLLAKSWFQIVLIPIFGGIFALVLYVIFLSGIIDGHLFPNFSMPDPPKDGADDAFMIALLKETYPKTGPDLAKLLFWSFVAGFSERFVPQIVGKITKESDKGK